MYHICDEVVVLDHLALLVPNVFCDDTFAAEHQPLREVVELFALVEVIVLFSQNLALSSESDDKIHCL